MVAAKAEINSLMAEEIVKRQEALKNPPLRRLTPAENENQKSVMKDRVARTRDAIKTQRDRVKPKRKDK